MADLKVEFPQPCSEPWDKMASRGCNRHCATCDKVIHELAALTFDEAAALLEAEDEVCVRAKVRSDGSIMLKQGAHGTTRRMMTFAGVTLALATAACHTVPDAQSDRFQITGEMENPYWAQFAELRSSNGKKQRKIYQKGSNQYVFSNLRPGVYTLEVRETCGIRLPVETITITNQSVVAKQGRPADQEEGGCPIIVGVMVPANRAERT